MPDDMPDDPTAARSSRSSRSSTDGPVEPLGTTAAALLGLLALRPWTTYELAKQAQRSLQWFWPRAERKLYDEPKKLVALGYATAEGQRTGRRRSTVYSITPAGRRALRRWLGDEPTAAPTFEIEQLVRVFFGDQGSADQLLAAIERAGAQARESLADLGSIVAAAEPDDRALRERDATSAIGLRLVLDLHRAIAGWSDWASAIVEEWDDTRHPGWTGYDDVFAEAIAFARPRED
jgi:PadR family transcriptional regulator AphA